MNDERGKEWGEIVEIYWKNKESRSVNNIEEQNVLKEWKKREDSRRGKKLQEDRRTQYQKRKKQKKRCTRTKRE